mgnify:CR=1 FL=1
MTLANTESRYGSVTKTFHWLTALLILTVIPLGIIANGLPYETAEQQAQKAWLFSLHKTVGVPIFFVALARILWAITQPKPGLLHPDRRLESWAAETVHWLLYGSLLLVPLSGWIQHSATTGFAPIWWPFGQYLPFVPKDEGLANLFAGLHMVLERVLVIALVLHIAGALKHHFVDKDTPLKRMWFGWANVPETFADHKMTVPFVSALAAWAVAIFIGSSLGMYNKTSGAVEAAQLQEVQSDWQVQDGTLGLTISQLGSAVEGSFADWTAAITFDETIQTGPAGKVEVTVSIGSLTLGAVTNDALGADYFNAEAFPTATFTADIEALEAGYVASGTLTIKEDTMPVDLPFDLTVEAGLASMTGTLTLDRRDFNIGNSQTDEGSLGFGVDVGVNLTARRPE